MNFYLTSVAAYYSPHPAREATRGGGGGEGVRTANYEDERTTVYADDCRSAARGRDPVARGGRPRSAPRGRLAPRARGGPRQDVSHHARPPRNRRRTTLDLPRARRPPLRGPGPAGHPRPARGLLPPS